MRWWVLRKVHIEEVVLKSLGIKYQLPLQFHCK